jgi:glycosyltransferase involved in cell wall biosynthesis
MSRRASLGTIAVGPALPGWGSWEWIGADLLRGLAPRCTAFQDWEEPTADVVVVVKHIPPEDWVERVARRSPIVYCPVDSYGSLDEVAADASILCRFARILVHCEPLRPAFEPYAPVETIDHTVKFAAPPRRRFVCEGFLLWVGVRSNLPPLVDWVNEHPLPGELVVLSNFEDPDRRPEPADVGFRPGLAVRLEQWSADRHVELTAACRAALDVKGEDFRARHKPPAKAVDILASGVPLALNPGSSPAAYLAGLGLDVASPTDVDRWLSRAYWEECRRVGRALRQRLTLPKVVARYRKILTDVCRERAESSSEPPTPPAPPAGAGLDQDVSAGIVLPAVAGPGRPVYGLLLTKDDEEVFDDWCRNQLDLYAAVVCLDGSESAVTCQIAARYAGRLVYLHERDFVIPHKTDHSLRRIAHQELVRGFGEGHWVMCCHPVEFCYHDPRRVAERAEQEGFDVVEWFTAQFYPHPVDLTDWDRRRHLPVPERFRYYHWDFGGDGLPSAECRLYRSGPGVAWDETTHGSMRPHGLTRLAPFRPILRHYKVVVADPAWYEPAERHARDQHHWPGQTARTGVPFPVRRFEDLFVAAVPGYARCDRFDGTFEQPWNIGEEFRPGGSVVSEAPAETEAWRARAAELAVAGRHRDAAEILNARRRTATDARDRAMAESDLAALAAVGGDLPAARSGFTAALATNPDCGPARHNLAVIDAPTDPAECPAPIIVPEPGVDFAAIRSGPAATKVAIVSFLFNWPSTGGGIVHTVELARFLGEAGYQVGHFYARFDPWEIGRVEADLAIDSRPLDFADSDWTLETILGRFRRAVDAFGPDYVIVTDSWNIKPLLAEALRHHRVILRLQAMECLCPLNNVRLLPGPNGRAGQCPKHQLATPDECRQCLDRLGRTSGSLHQAERALCGVGTAAYDTALRRAFREAEAVLVVNPLTEALVSPHTRVTRVVTAGMDPGRFVFPSETPSAADRPLRLLFAGLVDEWMKGFHVVHAACERLWRSRRDFELLTTADPPGPVDAFTRYVGWLSQAELPRQIRAADVLVMPTIAQEGLGRTAVEAMACGRPVVASRIGGLPATVQDGATGLLFDPGDAADLARKLEAVLDDPDLRRRLGAAGRRRFEEHYSWPVIIDRHYRPLLKPRPGSGTPPHPRSGFASVFREPVDQARLQSDVAALLGLSPARAAGLYRGCRALHEQERYAERLGESKTLTFEEAYVLYAVLATRRPACLVEIGTQAGRSARRLLDMRDALGLEAPLTCFDVEDGVEFVRRDEIEFVLGDVTGRLGRDVFDARPPGLVFLDAHPYRLVREAVGSVLADRRGWILAIHDGGPGQCNPHMAIGRDDPNVSSSTGVWERHLLAEAFGVADPLDPALDAAETATHRLRVFATQHGLAVVFPRQAPDATGRPA